MFLSNPFVFDTRVDKQARSLLQRDFDVRLLCRAAPDLPPREERQGLAIERFPLRKGHFVRALLLALGGPGPGAARRAVAKSPTRMRHPDTAPRTPRRDTADPRPQRASPLGSLLKPVVRQLPPSAARLSYSIDFARRAAELEPDLVVAHDTDTLLAGVLVRRALGTPLHFDSHELFVERNIGPASRWRERLFWRPFEKRWIHDAGAVTTVAEGIADELQERYGIERPVLVRNVQTYEPPPAPSSLLHERLGVQSSLQLVVYAGALTYHRGLEQMIDAATELPEDSAFVVMGYAQDPDYQSQLLQRARESGVLGRRIFFTDAVPMHEVTRYLAGATLGIVPTQAVCRSYELEASNKIFHCLMAGVPVVMSDHEEKRRLVETWSIGVLFDERDPSKIAAAVADLLRDEPRREELRGNCLEAAKELNWEKEEARYHRVIDRLLGGSGDRA